MNELKFFSIGIRKSRSRVSISLTFIEIARFSLYDLCYWYTSFCLFMLLWWCLWDEGYMWSFEGCDGEGSGWFKWWWSSKSYSLVKKCQGWVLKRQYEANEGVLNLQRWRSNGRVFKFFILLKDQRLSRCWADNLGPLMISC